MRTEDQEEKIIFVGMAGEGLRRLQQEGEGFHLRPHGLKWPAEAAIIGGSRNVLGFRKEGESARGVISPELCPLS